MVEIPKQRTLAAELAAEFAGTFILILFGVGVVAQVVAGGIGDHDSIAWAWGLGVVLGVYVAARISGAHLNPAVTVGFATAGTIDWSDVPEYLAGEFVGAFIGATLVWAAYLDHWAATEDPGLKLACYCTAPAIRNTVSNLITEVIGTFVLVFGVLAFFANKATADTGLGGLLVGLLVLSIGLSLGGPTGYAINPARDLGPRIMHAILPIAGKGGSDWSYALIPVVGPLIGGVLVALAFNLFYPG